jgi:hypothetical protein
LPDLWEHIAFVKQQSMHIPYKPQIIFVSRGLADCLTPLLNGFQYFTLYAARTDRRALWEAPNKLIEELLGADLQVKWIATVFDAIIEESEGKEGDIRISVIDELNNCDGALTRRIALFGVYQVNDLKV